MDDAVLFHLKMLAHTVLAPVGAVAVLAVLAALVPVRYGGARAALVGLGVAAGMAVGFGLIAGWPAVPPVDTAGWLVFAAIAAALLFGVFELVAVPPPVREAVRLVLAVGLAGLLFVRVGPQLDWGWTAWGRWAVLPAVAAAAAWAALEAAARRGPSAAAPAAALLGALGLSAASLLGASAKMAQLAGSWAAVLGAACLIAWRWPALRFGRAAAAAAMLPLGGLAAYVHYFVEVPPAALLLAGCSTLAAWAGVLAARRGARPLAALLLVALLAALPAAGAGYLAYRAAQPAQPASAEDAALQELYGF
ncbi:MAG: hypothetical protein KatS3mg102_2243 [Planctomycetota bacterium]|nr:MAG: hypothetical protein KatS3mg102_2243 [Planctomycetota bacterium]